MSHPTIGTSDGKPIRLDLERLIDSRLLVQARSGGGKSWLLRRLAEQTYGQVQQIILDVEGEFPSLRERFDYIVAAAQGGDTLAHPRTAALLARRLLELGVSAIVDLYELKAHERPRFIKLFLDSMMNAPKSLWHPCMVIVDEAHNFCPQSGSSESMQSVIDLATRGRKRGYCAVLATQRLSKLHKDAAAEMQNKLIGGTSLDVDVKRAADELGMNTKDAITALRNLLPGEFFAYGPALSQTVVRVDVGSVQTKHPKAGQRGGLAPIVAPSKKIADALAKLSDLPKEAEQEQKSLDDLRKENANLKRQISMTVKTVVKPVYTQSAPKIIEKRVEVVPTRLKRMIAGLPTHLASLAKHVEAINAAVAEGAPPTLQAEMLGRVFPRPLTEQPRHSEADNGSLRSGARRILQELCARHPATYSRSQVGVLTKFTHTGGTFTTYLGDLKRAGFVEERDGELSATEAGFAYLGDDVPKAPSTHEDAMALWRRALRSGAFKMLAAIVEAGANGLSREDVARSVEMEVTGGTFTTYLGDLRRNGLITERDGVAVACDILFP